MTMFQHHEDVPGANAEITISRDSGNAFKIKIIDKASRVRVVEVSMDAASFAFALTGLSAVHVIADYGEKLEHLGKTKVIEQRVVDCPLGAYDKAVLGKWLLDNCQEDGWTIDTSLGSQNSVNPRLDGEKGQRLRYSVFKWAEA